MAKFVKVKVFKTTAGKLCMHCGRQATVTAYRLSGTFKLPVRYCAEHAEIRGAIKAA